MPRTVMLHGEVQFPGRYTLTTRDERVSDLIKRAGGLTPEAYAAGLVFYRAENRIGRVGIDLPRVLKDRAHRDNMLLTNGDSLFVPRYVSMVDVRGAVNSPIAVAYEPRQEARLLYPRRRRRYVEGRPRTRVRDAAERQGGEREALARMAPDGVPSSRRRLGGVRAAGGPGGQGSGLRLDRRRDGADARRPGGDPGDHQAIAPWLAPRAIAPDERRRWRLRRRVLQRRDGTHHRGLTALSRPFILVVLLFLGLSFQMLTFSGRLAQGGAGLGAGPQGLSRTVRRLRTAPRGAGPPGALAPEMLAYFVVVGATALLASLTYGPKAMIVNTLRRVLPRPSARRPANGWSGEGAARSPLS